MANQIKHAGDGLALQVTKPARSAGLVEEDTDGDATYRAAVRVYAFDHLLLVVDVETISTNHIADLVDVALRDTNSIYRAMDATVKHSGHGYQVQLPPAEDAGFEEGDTAPCSTQSGLLVITNADGTSAARDAARLADDLLTIRHEQG